MNATFYRNLSQVLFYKFFIFKTPQNDINQCLFLYVTGGQTVDFGCFFGQSPPLFGLYQNLFSASVRSIALRLTAFFVSTHVYEEAFSHIKIIKILKPSDG
jgi:hypothetical protein